MKEEDDILVLLGKNIRKHRTLQNVSQNQLAFETNVSREFINKIESGRYNVSVRTLEKIANSLGLRINDLFI